MSFLYLARPFLVVDRYVLDRFAEFVLAYGDHCTRYEKPQAIFPCRAPARPSNKENPQFVKRMVRAIVRGVIHSRDFPEDSFKP